MRKYPKTTGYYPYYHRLPNKMCYFGMSNQQPSKRWAPSQYKGTSLQPGIEEFGWDNIEHGIITDGLTKRQAEVIEDWFIKNATKDGFCINQRRSGGIKRDNPQKYNKQQKQTQKRKDWEREYQQRPEVKERQREREKRLDVKEYRREYKQRPEYKEYLHKYYQSPERKKYQREYMRQWRLKKKQEKLLSDNIS